MAKKAVKKGTARDVSKPKKAVSGKAAAAKKAGAVKKPLVTKSAARPVGKPATKLGVPKSGEAKSVAKNEQVKMKLEKPTKSLKEPVAEVAVAAKPATLQKSEEKSAKPAKAVKEKKTSKKKAAEIAAGIEQGARWADLKEKFGKVKAPKYNMTGKFEMNQGIEHNKLGWGYVLSNLNDRLEVLFESGIRILISNYNQDPKI